MGKGQIYQVSLKEDEEYVVHPSNVVAYAQNGFPPQPYRFRSSTLSLQVPSLGALLPDTRFFNEMRKSGLWKFLAEALYKTRTWTRRNVWGDRLFLQFKGPTTILIQSRGSRIGDSLSAREVNEIADAPAGVVKAALAGEVGKETEDVSEETAVPGSSKSPAAEVGSVKPASVSWATVSRGGKVDFKEQDARP